MPRVGPSTWDVARQGVDLAVEALRARGALVERVSDPYSRNALTVVAPDGQRLVAYVTTRRRGDWQSKTPKGQPRQEDRDERRFWLFVDLLDDPPTFRIAPCWWIENNIYEVHQAYLAKHGGNRARNPKATHHRITDDRVERWRNRWDLLALPLQSN